MMKVNMAQTPVRFVWYRNLEAINLKLNEKNYFYPCLIACTKKQENRKIRWNGDYKTSADEVKKRRIIEEA